MDRTQAASREERLGKKDAGSVGDRGRIFSNRKSMGKSNRLGCDLQRGTVVSPIANSLEISLEIGTQQFATTGPDLLHNSRA